MQSRAKLLGHSIHQMLIPFPIGLLTTAIIFDIIRLSTQNPLWSTIAYWLIVAGIIGGLTAALFGAADWTGIPGGSRAKRIATLHGVGNVIMVGLFALSWWLRSGNPAEPSGLALTASFAGAALSLLTAWLGGELVDRMAVGVDDGAHVNSPSSLSGLPARDSAVTSVTRP